MSTAFILYIYDYETGEYLTEASEWEAGCYLARLQEVDPQNLRDGMLYGYHFGFIGRFICMTKDRA